MKILAMVLVMLVIIVGGLAGIIAATGNLNAEGLARILGQSKDAESALPEKTPSTDTLAEENRSRMTAIEEREQKADEREKQLTQREKDLEALRVQIETMKKQVEGTMADQGSEREKQIESQANTITAMKPAAAAQMLEKFPVEDQAEIVKRVTKVKDRAKILEAMKPETAARIMTYLQQPSGM